MTSAFSDREIDVLEKLLRREIGSVDALASLDPKIANESKLALKQLLEKVKSNPGLFRDSDILAHDEEVTFDEVVFAKNGDPIARIRLPKGIV